ncbi:ATP-grasp domain-containing protein [Acetobacterium fimetarium]|uniref:ATP-grasp domain-containing protein n=1 Tax=Acetobacterium fimetarium TaxID=52691 RepID=A0ABR6WTT3_9FIRM|nr:ATP-grasp domain-containing protein [Acetobacterium fimetarium]MBC3803976.1 ATP-grasp domain-containing protein [Acetobacterium fimetarium]
MRLQILGGGNNQLGAIRRAAEQGHEVILVDYFKNPPGRVYATFNEVVSTFDVEKNIEIAKKYRVDGVMTMGTDQPVYTVARVAEALQLPAFLDVPTARAVTNKEIMKAIMTANQIPTVPYRFLTKAARAEDLDKIPFPVVIKPLDSQGQRGVFKLNTPAEVIKSLPETLSFSRAEKVLLESFYPSDEITVSAWVDKGVPDILTITDRESFSFERNIGICFAHEYPSRHQHRAPEIRALVQNITRAFQINAGPLYIQLLVGDRGIVVNEVAGRIGGAHEDIFIPYLTGFDILDRVINFSLGIDATPAGAAPPRPRSERLNEHLSVQLFFAKPGKITSLTSLESLRKLPGVIAAGYNVAVGETLETIANATARAGYLVMAETSERALHQAINQAFRALKIIDEQRQNLVIQPKAYLD